jgi:hypothetical protein
MGDIPPVPDWMSDLAQQAGMSDSAKESAERDARWIGDFADDLNVAIALREWDRAVELVEQGVFLPACHGLVIVCLTSGQARRSSPLCRPWQQSSPR